MLLLGLAQLDPADLAGDGLRQVVDLEPPHALEGREPLAQVAEDREHRLAVSLDPLRQHQVCLGHGEPHRIRRRHHRGLDHRLVLDQHALELEGRDAVVGRLEHVVGAADVDEGALGVPRRHVAGAVGDGAERREAAVILLVALHQPRRRRVEQDRDLALRHLLVLGVEQADAVARRGMAHAARRHLLPGEVADLQRRLGLAIALAHGHAPDALHVLDHLRVQRLAGRAELAQLAAEGRHVLLHQHAPDRGWRAEGLHAMRRDRLQRGLRIEARLVVDEDRGAGIPGREEAGIGVLRPARRGDVQVHVARPQAEPVHRRQVADRIALLVVQHELRLGRGAGGEVEQQRIRRARLALRREGSRALQQRVVLRPARGAADRDARDGGIEPLELRRIAAIGDDVPHPPAREAVPQVGAVEQRRRRDHHRAELHRRQHRLPQRHDVAEHHQDAVAALHPHGAQPVGQPAGIGRELGEAAHRRAVAGDAQRLGVAERAAGELGIEPVERVVEGLEPRPAEVAAGGGVVLAVGEEEVAGLLECGSGHRHPPRSAWPNGRAAGGMA